MNVFDRDDIYNINRHSNLSAGNIQKLLDDNVYSSPDNWKKFLRLFLFTLGVGFSAAGIIFFFAYNWDNIQKFAKLGIIEGLIVILTVIVIIPKMNNLVRNIILSTAAVMVGVLFAVFGQIYQTGADAYDFFMGWTIFITLWVVISNFPPLWLIFIALLNTTLVLYNVQVSQNWSEMLIYLLLIIINTLFISGFSIAKKYNENIQSPGWFIKVIGIFVALVATIGITRGIEMSFHDKFEMDFIWLIILTIIIYTIGIINGYRQKRIFEMSIIPVSLLIIIASYLVNQLQSFGIFLFNTFIIVVFVTFLIRFLIKLQWKWSNEK